MATIGRQEGETGVTSTETFLIFARMVGLASRCALGDGATREEVAQWLESEAYAIRTEDVAENMSPILFPMN